MAPDELTVTAEVWKHTGQAAWHFITLPEDAADEVRARAAGRSRPFGSFPARVTLGTTSWDTSLFADTKAGSYLLPLKAQVRRREGVAEGDLVTVRIALT